MSISKNIEQEPPLIVLIRLKSASQRVELEAKNAYTKSGFYCVYLSDDTVHKYPISDLFDVELQPGLLTARNTPALMRVSIHLKGTHLPVELAPDSTSQNEELFTANMPSGASKLYPVSNIEFVAEDYGVSCNDTPVSTSSGPLENGRTGSHESSVPGEDSIIHQILTPENQSKIGHDFKYLLDLIDVVGVDISNPRPNCSAEHMLLLCQEGLTGLDKYPEDKLGRWLGFCAGVLEAHDIGCDLKTWQGYSSLIEEDKNATLKPYEVGVMQDLFIRYKEKADTFSATDARALKASARCAKACTHLMVLKLNQVSVELGIVQGMLAAVGAIDVEAEREYTRPILHSIHQGSVLSFPAR